MPRTVFTVGGTVQAGGGRYLSRRVDDEFLEVCRNGEFAYVLTARQMGKSSLMVRTAERLAREGTRSVIVDLSQVGVRVTPDEWYLGILTEVEEALGLETDVYEWWEKHAHLGLTQRLTQFFREVALEEVDQNIVVFFDEIDSTLSLDFTDDFFAAIRYVYNARSKVSAFNRLSFVLIGVATPSDLISDPKRTPFNIGRRVDVEYFTFQEALPLAEGFVQTVDRGQMILQWVLAWTGGHPYLTQRLAYAVAQNDCSKVTQRDVRSIVAATFFGERSEQDSNLRFVHDMLTARAPDPTAILLLYKSVLAGKRVDDEKQSRNVTHLKLSGVVRGERGALVVQNAIYQHVFDLNWLNRQWPEHWIRRVPPAIIGLVAAVFIAVVLLGLVLMESGRRSQAQEYGEELAAVNEQLLVQQDSVVSLNSQLNAQLVRSDSLREVAETARSGLARQYAVTDALRREEAQLNEELSREVGRAESLLVEVQLANESLAHERDHSDSLRRVAVNRLDLARLARRETITIALANKAVRLLNLGDPELAALLARQAYAFSDPENAEFLDPIYDALRQSLNAVGGEAGGPEVATRHDGGVRHAVFRPDGAWLATAGDDGKIGVVPVGGAAGVAVAQYITAHDGGVRALSYSHDGTFLYSAGEDGYVREWRFSSGAKPASSEVSRHDGGAWAVASSTTGQWVVSGGRKGDVIVAERAGSSFQERARLRLESGVRTLAFIDEQPIVAIGSDDGALTVWSFRGGPEAAHTVDSGHGRVLAIAAHPNGILLASAGEDRMVRVWPVAPDGTPGEAIVLEGHEGAVNDVAFSPDGKQLVTASADHSVRIWQRYADGDKAPIILQQHEAWVWAAEFSPDGLRLATASEDRTAQLWRTEMATMAADICRVVGNRVLTRDEWDQHVGGDFDFETEYASCASADATSPITLKQLPQEPSP